MRLANRETISHYDGFFGRHVDQAASEDSRQPSGRRATPRVAMIENYGPESVGEDATHHHVSSRNTPPESTAISMPSAKPDLIFGGSTAPQHDLGTAEEVNDVAAL